MPFAGPIQVKEQHLDQWHVLLREKTDELLSLFRTVNLVVLGFVVLLWIVDEIHFQMSKGPFPERLVTTQVILALIGASTAQLGVLAVAVGKGIFRMLDDVRRDP